MYSVGPGRSGFNRLCLLQALVSHHCGNHSWAIEIQNIPAHMDTHTRMHIHTHTHTHMRMQVAKVSLSPANRKKTEATPVKQESKPDKPNGKPSPPATSPTPSRESPSELVAGGRTEAFLRSPSPKVLNIVRSSKYRHIEGHMMHRSTTIDKIPKLSTIVPGDSDAFQVCLVESLSCDTWAHSHTRDSVGVLVFGVFV